MYACALGKALSLLDTSQIREVIGVRIASVHHNWGHDDRSFSYSSK